jgi:hypothetical protein
MLCLTNICVTHSRMMHLTFTRELHGSQIVQHILDNLRMANVACYQIFCLRTFHL